MIFVTLSDNLLLNHHELRHPPASIQVTGFRSIRRGHLILQHPHEGHAGAGEGPTVREKAKLTAKRQKLVEAIYSGAMPMELIADEQRRIGSQLASIEERLSAATATFDTIEADLTNALNLAQDCHAAYLSAPPHVRRLFNQAFFTPLLIDEEDDIQHAYAAQTIQKNPEGGRTALTEALERAVQARTLNKPPRALRATGGLTTAPSAPGVVQLSSRPVKQDGAATESGQI